jgi:hypothetical protein
MMAKAALLILIALYLGQYFHAYDRVAVRKDINEKAALSWQ